MDGAFHPVPGDQLATIDQSPISLLLAKPPSNLCTETENRLESAEKQLSVYESEVSNHTKTSDGIEEKVKALNMKKRNLLMN